MKSIKFNGKEIQPSKVVCVGRNYVEHIKELNNEMPTEPVIFIKPNSAISNNLHANETEEIHYEGEICFLINNGQIQGVGFGLDLTKRKLQSTLKNKGLPWERAKAFDKSAVFSEFVDCGELQSYSMELYINNELIQVANYDLMIHKPDSLLNDITQFLTLEDGDIIMTGTPKGVGVVKLGDKFTAKLFSSDNLIIESSWTAE